MKVAFRVDASSQIGTGHLARCLTLANALRAAGAETRIVCRHFPETMAEQVRAGGHALSILPHSDAPAEGTLHADWLGTSQESDARGTAAALLDGAWDWLVVDHYALDRAWESILRPSANRILAIDDLADRSHVCDMLLDQNLQPEGRNRYEGLLPENCRTLIGPRYALLRPEFRDVPPRAENGPVRRLNIFFGGVDAAGMTLRALDEIAPLLDGQVNADVVAGTGNPQLAAIRQRCNELGVILHVQSAEMAKLFAAADLGLGAGGATSWERCRMGLPSLVVCIADNQYSGCRALTEHCAALCLGDAAELLPGTLRAAVARLMSDAPTRMAMAHHGQALVDGRGTERVVLTMLRDDITLRTARTEDAEMTWGWRNHPDTRRFFHDPSPVERETHLAWWNAAMQASDRAVLIARCGDINIGVLRFDCGDAQALVSIYLDPALTGLGLGTMMLRIGTQWIAANKPDINCLKAEILPQNIQSTQTFASAGYVRESGIHWIRSVH